MHRLRSFPFSGAFQRGSSAAPSAPEDKRAPHAHALWPDNKALVPEPAPSEPAPKKSGKSEKRAAQKNKTTAPKSLRLPPAPPLDAIPPFGTLAAEPEAEPSLAIAPRFSPAAQENEAPTPPEDTLLLTEPLTISPSFLAAAPPASEKPEMAAQAPLAIQPQILGQDFTSALSPENMMQANEKLMEALTQALQDNLGTLREVRNQLAQQAVELALAAARSIAGHAIAADSLQVLRARLPELLAPQNDAPSLHISVCVEDAQAARTLVHGLAQSYGYLGAITVEADPRLERGDAMVHWRHYAWRSLVAERRATVEASVARYLAQLQDSQLPAAPAKEDESHG